MIARCRTKGMIINMKKILSIVLVLTFALLISAGCSAPAEPAAPPVEKGSVIKLGLGHITSIAKSSDLGKDTEGKEILPLGQVDTVMAAVGFDKDGRVVSVTIDSAQTKVTFDAALQITSDIKAEGKTNNMTKGDINEEDYRFCNNTDYSAVDFFRLP